MKFADETQAGPTSRRMAICFVHKSKKNPYFEPTLDHITLRNFRTVRLIFTKIASKVAQDSKEKSHESAARGKKILRNYRAKRQGGVDSTPPPVWLGLSTCIYQFICFTCTCICVNTCMYFSCYNGPSTQALICFSFGPYHSQFLYFSFVCLFCFMVK